MTDEEKKEELLHLIDILCDRTFVNDDMQLEGWIQKLNKIYANGYRHAYSDISYKIQSIISNNDSEVLEILGENLSTCPHRKNMVK